MHVSVREEPGNDARPAVVEEFHVEGLADSRIELDLGLLSVCHEDNAGMLTPAQKSNSRESA